MLEIRNLCVETDGKAILKGINLSSARHHGAERLRQEHAGPYPRRS